MSSKLRYGLVGLAFTGLLVGMVFSMRLAQPKVASLQPDQAKSRGSADALVQIIEFSDFQCPACQGAQAVLTPLLTQYPDQIRLTFQHFPIQGHPWSLLAHQASECAARQDRFWVYHDRLYAEQTNWSKSAGVPIEIFMRYAGEAGLGLEEFAACLSDVSVNQKIRDERSAGMGLGIRSTPTFFVNGEMVVGFKDLQAKAEAVLGKRE